MSSLSQKEKNILAAAQLRAGVPASEISRLVGYSERVVRYTLKSLSERQLIHRRFCINVYNLGLSYFALALNLKDRTPSAREAFLNFITASPEISYCVELVGPYQFNIDICTSGPDDVLRILDKMDESIPGGTSGRELTHVVSLTDYPMKFLNQDQRVGKEQVRLSRTRTTRSFDQIDHAILTRLSCYNGDSLRSLAEEMNVSPSSFSYRLGKLTESGVLLGARYLFDVSSSDLQSFIHVVRFRPSESVGRATFRSFCSAHSNIYYFLEGAGAWDFELGTTVEGTKCMNRIVEELHQRFGHAILELQTYALVKFHKLSNYPLVDSLSVH